MNNKLHQKLENELLGLVDAERELSPFNANFHIDAKIIIDRMMAVQTAIDEIQWTDQEIDADEARYNH